VTLKVYQWPLAADYIEGLAPEKQEQVARSINHLAEHFPAQKDEVDIDGSDSVLVARISEDETVPERLIVIEVKPEARARALKSGRRRPRHRKRELTREQAAAIVEAGIGNGTNLPSGAEYVDNLRYVWKGLAPRGDSSS